MAVVFKALNFTIGLVEVAVSGLVTGIQTIADAITWLMIKLNNLAAKIPGAGRLGITPIDASNEQIFKGTIASAMNTQKLAQDVFDSLFNSTKAQSLKASPAMTGVSMASLAKSSYEKMGFVIGSAKASEVPNLIRGTNAILSKIYSAIAYEKGAVKQPSYSPIL